MYVSLSTALNASLKNQLIHLYKVLCNEDGSLEVTVVLKQHQKGASDCGLYSIANAVALTLGIHPCAVIWLQNEMRQHLVTCFQDKTMKMFPHSPSYLQPNHKKSHYVISVYCVCFRHIPGAEMVNCNSCKNWYHHMPPQNCINLSTKQISALVTDNPFVCAYCELSQK